MPELKTNLLYFGDNLEWLRNVGRFPDESSPYPIVGLQDLIDDKLPRMPQGARTPVFAQAQRERKREGIQGRLT